MHQKTKHLDVQLHFIRDVNEKFIKLKHVTSELNIADILTKSLDSAKISKLNQLLSLRGEEQAHLVAEYSYHCSSKSKMKRELALIMAILLASPSQVLLLGPKYIRREETVLLRYYNPCEFMVTDELRQEINEINAYFEQAQAKNEMPKSICKSPLMFKFEACILKSTKLTQTISRFPNIVHHVTKRDIKENIYEGVVELSSVVYAAATTWIKSVAVDTGSTLLYELSKDLLDKLIQIGHEDYKNMTIVPYDVLRDQVLRVSLYTDVHPDLLDNAVKSEQIENSVDNYLDYVSDEFIASEVLLSGIYIMLKQGKIDTRA